MESLRSIAGRLQRMQVLCKAKKAKLPLVAKHPTEGRMQSTERMLCYECPFLQSKVILHLKVVVGNTYLLCMLSMHPCIHASEECKGCRFCESKGCKACPFTLLNQVVLLDNKVTLNYHAFMHPKDAKDLKDAKDVR